MFQPCRFYHVDNLLSLKRQFGNDFKKCLEQNGEIPLLFQREKIKLMKSMNTAKILILFGIAGYSLLCVRPARAADHTVYMYYYDFGSGQYYDYSPATLSVPKGDTVTWVNGDIYPYGGHTATSGTVGSPDGLWDSGVVANQGDSYTLDTSTISPGSYPFFCTVDYYYGMAGTLTITGPPNVPPTVNITNPVSGAVFAAPANITIQATVANGSGSVTNVQFRVGSGVLINKTTAPYSATTNNLPAGGYTFMAIATDNNGLTATNAATISVVTPVTVTLTNAARLAGTNFQFKYAANVGLSYVIQRSTNPASANWLTLVTNVAASNPAVFVDNHATNNPNFYRVGRLPNP